jgi:hypothetical protein
MRPNKPSRPTRSVVTPVSSGRRTTMSPALDDLIVRRVDEQPEAPAEDTHRRVLDHEPASALVAGVKRSPSSPSANALPPALPHTSSVTARRSVPIRDHTDGRDPRIEQRTTTTSATVVAYCSNSAGIAGSRPCVRRRCSLDDDGPRNPAAPAIICRPRMGGSTPDVVVHCRQRWLFDDLDSVARRSRDEVIESARSRVTARLSRATCSPDSSTSVCARGLDGLLVGSSRRSRPRDRRWIRAGRGFAPPLGLVEKLGNKAYFDQVGPGMRSRDSSPTVCSRSCR